jgi:AcrR family transcriptional regulator
MATVDAIFEATIQLLLTDGLHRLTTTRVADRAGVSVGTMYQYFPNKQALIYALNERYLGGLAEKIEATCHAHHGAPIGRMVDSVIDTYWKAKTERADVTRALYLSVAEMDNSDMVETFARRVNSATAAMFKSAPDATFADLASVNLTLITVIFGTVRNAFEQRLSAEKINMLQSHLRRMCHSYISDAANTS